MLAATPQRNRSLLSLQPFAPIVARRRGRRAMFFGGAPPKPRMKESFTRTRCHRQEGKCYVRVFALAWCCCVLSGLVCWFLVGGAGAPVGAGGCPLGGGSLFSPPPRPPFVVWPGRIHETPGSAPYH